MRALITILVALLASIANGHGLKNNPGWWLDTKSSSHSKIGNAPLLPPYDNLRLWLEFSCIRSGHPDSGVTLRWNRLPPPLADSALMKEWSAPGTWIYKIYLKIDGKLHFVYGSAANRPKTKTHKITDDWMLISELDDVHDGKLDETLRKSADVVIIMPYEMGSRTYTFNPAQAPICPTEGTHDHSESN